MSGVPSGRKRVVAGASTLAAAMTTACVVHHQPIAAGAGDVRVPPRDPMLRASEPPDDPGEQTTAATAGFFVGGGGRWANTAGVSATMGIEARLSRSTNPYSTNPKAAGYTPLALPWDAGHSLAIGAALAQHDGLGWHVGAVYAEAQRFVAWLGAGAGYAWEPTSEAHGPQATLWVGPLWLSSRYLWHDGLQLHLGIAVQFNVAKRIEGR